MINVTITDRDELIAVIMSKKIPQSLIAEKSKRMILVAYMKGEYYWTDYRPAWDMMTDDELTELYETLKEAE